MKTVHITLAVVLAASLAACGRGGDQGTQETAPAEPATTTEESAPMADTNEATEIEPGLTMRIVREGSGDVAEAGQLATVHYTGWLYDPSAPENRGTKFDSSVDRDEYFDFPLGAGRVIQGWDRGVVGMKIGEVRELIIAPELAYGNRAVGDLIPAGSTLLFEVELAGLDGNVP